jgi:hypothetical protein
MEFWMEQIFGNWVGLLSMIVLAATLGIWGWFVFFFLRKSH